MINPRTLEEIDGRTYAAARAILGLTQEQLAQRAGLDPSTVSAVEREPTRSMMSTRQRLVAAFRRLGVRVSPTGVRRDPRLLVGSLW